jgi:hypothetical protein
VSYGAVRISNVVWLCCLPPLVQLSQTCVGRSGTGPTWRAGFLNAGVFSTVLDMCYQVLVCYDVSFPGVRQNWSVVRFCWRRESVQCVYGDGTVRNKVWRRDHYSEGGKWGRWWVWFSRSGDFRITECVWQFSPHRGELFLILNFRPVLSVVFSLLGDSSAPGNHPKVSIQHSENGKSLKSGKLRVIMK